MFFPLLFDRVILQKQSVVGWAETESLAARMTSKLAESGGRIDPAATPIRGWFVEESADVIGVRMHVTQPQDDIPWLVRILILRGERLEESHSKLVESRSTEPQLIDLPIEAYLQPNDVLSLAFERPGNNGPNNAQLRICAGSILTRKG